MVEFGEDLEWTFVMGGLAREYGPDDYGPMTRHWLEASDESGMPTDPLAWAEAPLASTYPACLAVKAAQEQGRVAAYRYLRALREGIVCRRRKLDSTEALVEEARAVGLDADRFRRDLSSSKIAEAFEADLEESRDVPQVARNVGKVRCSADIGEERVPFPTLRFTGEDGAAHWTCGMRSLDFVRDAALAAGAEPASDPRPTVLEALDRFGTMASVEVAAVCDLSLPRVEAELAALALDSQIASAPILAGRLWTPA
jgi:putative protein-disulfide isomerase